MSELVSFSAVSVPLGALALSAFDGSGDPTLASAEATSESEELEDFDLGAKPSSAEIASGCVDKLFSIACRVSGSSMPEGDLFRMLVLLATGSW